MTMRDALDVQYRNSDFKGLFTSQLSLDHRLVRCSNSAP